MKVTTIGASVRYSKSLGDGSHKTVEMGAEASLESGEAWREAQASLYHQLGQQLKALWGNGNGKAQERPTTKEATPEHYCQAHGQEYRRFERNGRVWYSHRTSDGKWCKEGSK